MRAVTQRVMARVPSGSWGDPDVSAETGRYHSGCIGIDGLSIRSVCGRFALFGSDSVVQIAVEFTRKYVTSWCVISDTRRIISRRRSKDAAHCQCSRNDLLQAKVRLVRAGSASTWFDRPGPRLAMGALRSTRLGFWCWFRSSISEPAFRSRLRRQIEYPDQSAFSA